MSPRHCPIEDDDVGLDPANDFKPGGAVAGLPNGSDVHAGQERLHELPYARIVIGDQRLDFRNSRRHGPVPIWTIAATLCVIVIFHYKNVESC